jgi:hypothetical protein
MHVLYSVAKAQNGKIDPDKTIALLNGLKFESPPDRPPSTRRTATSFRTSKSVAPTAAMASS